MDLNSIKNPHLRARILQAQETAPVPRQQKPVVQRESSSTIIAAGKEKSTELFFTVKGLPMGKPRMSQRDKWMKRPCVLRYRAYCDQIRATAGVIPNDPLAIHVKAYIPMTAGWSAKKKALNSGQRHRLKPDWDNIGKGICDALFEEDSCIAVGITEKFWCEAGQERTEVKVIYEESALRSIRW